MKEENTKSLLYKISGLLVLNFALTFLALLDFKLNFSDFSKMFGFLFILILFILGMIDLYKRGEYG